ncbi:acyltransferase family protein [Paraburkholderia lacunae]|nr:acyltransferase [Paraburkholderia lacunae]
MRTQIVDSKIEALDGIRGAAVLMVMLYHFAHVTRVSHSGIDAIFYKVALTGWVGVDIFFALSGFLISGILLRSKNSDGYLRSFYGRRALRIFPLYYLYLGFLFFVLYPLISNKVSGAESAKVAAALDAWPWFVFYLSNVKQAIAGVFFGAGAGHLWSLAIEEQFYFIWPLIVLLASEIALIYVCIGLLFLGLIVRIYLSMHGVSPEVIYVFTPGRIDGLISGSLLAVFVHRNLLRPTCFLLKGPPAAFLLFIVALIAFGSRAEASPLIYTVGFSILALIVAGLINSARYSSTRSVFRTRALMLMGKYSYALYIIHPIIREAALRMLGKPRLLFGSQLPWQVAFSAGCVCMSIIAALISWHIVEKHFMALKDRLFPHRDLGSPAFGGHKPRSRAESPGNFEVIDPNRNATAKTPPI